MEVDLELAGYLVYFYHEFLTEEEKLAHGHLMGTLKMTRARDDLAAQEEVLNRHPEIPGLLSKDPNVLALAKDGSRAFLLRTGNRVFADDGHRILLNRCRSVVALRERQAQSSAGIVFTIGIDANS